ncbi:hypothetical protein GCM10009611_27910 [Arthrobacter roseus]
MPVRQYRDVPGVEVPAPSEDPPGGGQSEGITAYAGQCVLKAGGAAQIQGSDFASVVGAVEVRIGQAGDNGSAAKVYGLDCPRGVGA